MFLQTKGHCDRDRQRAGLWATSSCALTDERQPACGRRREDLSACQALTGQVPATSAVPTWSLLLCCPFTVLLGRFSEHVAHALGFQGALTPSFLCPPSLPFSSPSLHGSHPCQLSLGLGAHPWLWPSGRQRLALPFLAVGSDITALGAAFQVSSPAWRKLSGSCPCHASSVC